MVRAKTATVTLALIAAWTTSAHAASPRYLASRDIVLECRPANGTVVQAADLWMSTDGGRSWQTVELERAGPTTLRYKAPADGRYDFYVVLRNAAGASGDPPKAGTAPITTVIVDTVPPLLQVHDCRVEYVSDEWPTVVVRASFVEENAPKVPIHIFFRTLGKAWLDGGPATLTDNRITWDPPESAGPVIDLRVTAKDLAGNQTWAEIPNVALPARPDAAREAELPTSAPASQPAQRGIRPVDPVRVAKVAPPKIGPFATAADVSPTTLPAGPTGGEAADVQKLRSLAARFSSEGRYSLAAARLEDALALAPTDADLLAAYGNALYRLERYDEARARFQAVIEAAPDHLAALDGLALVAVTQKHYPEAREHLRHLTRLRPDAGVFWLRGGDVEHQLGNATQALEAWQRALKAKDATDDLRKNAQRRLDYFGPRQP